MKRRGESKRESGFSPVPNEKVCLHQHLDLISGRYDLHASLFITATLREEGASYGSRL